MSAGAKRRRENAVKEQNGLCYFCGCFMLPSGAMDGRKPHPKAATIDHLNPRLSPGRVFYSMTVKVHNPRGKKVCTVASCWQCNNDRNREYQASLPKSLLNAQSHGH